MLSDCVENINYFIQTTCLVYSSNMDCEPRAPIRITHVWFVSSHVVSRRASKVHFTRKNLHWLMQPLQPCERGPTSHAVFVTSHVVSRRASKVHFARKKLHWLMQLLQPCERKPTSHLASHRPSTSARHMQQFPLAPATAVTM